MAVTSSDFLAALLTNYQAQFGQTWNDPANSDVLLSLAQRFQSSTLTETIPFVGAVSAGPTDITSGTVPFEDMKQYYMEIANKTWGSGFEVQREAFADDRYKLYASKPSELAMSHKMHVGELVGDLFETGKTAIAYDGIEFFANSRATGTTGLAFDNLGTATGTYTTASNLYLDIRTAQQYFMSLTNDQGRKLGLRGNVIVVPGQLYDQFYTALSYNSTMDRPAGQFAPPGDSFSVGGYTVVLNRRLTDAADWYMLHVDAKRGMMPFIWTDREVPSIDGTTDVNSYEWRVLRKAQYTTYGRYAAGFGNPLLAYMFD